MVLLYHSVINPSVKISPRCVNGGVPAIRLNPGICCFSTPIAAARWIARYARRKDYEILAYIYEKPYVAYDYLRYGVGPIYTNYDPGHVFDDAISLAFAGAESLGAIAGMVHNHPDGNTTPSFDDQNIGLFGNREYRAPNNWIADNKGNLGGDFLDGESYDGD